MKHTFLIIQFYVTSGLGLSQMSFSGTIFWSMILSQLFGPILSFPSLGPRESTGPTLAIIEFSAKFPVEKISNLVRLNKT